MSIDRQDLNRLAVGHGQVIGSDGSTIGRIGQLYTDDETDEPTWVSVKTGLFGTQESFVPLAGATVEGDDIRVPHDKDTVKGAPRIDAEGTLTPQEEQRLHDYYRGERQAGIGSGTDTGTDTETGRAEDRDAPTAETGDESVPGPAGGGPRTRLRRVVVTEIVEPVDVDDEESRR